MKFLFFNDTGRVVHIAAATLSHGVKVNGSLIILPFIVKTFILPEGTYPMVKMWDYGEEGLSIFVSPIKEEEMI